MIEGAPPVVLHPAREEDKEKLFELVLSIRSGIPSLPKDLEALGNRIEKSLKSFNRDVHKPGKENYLFVLENVETGKLVGCSGLKALINGEAPYYSYEIKREKNSHDPLGINVENDALHLTTIENVTELVSLFLNRDNRYANHGKLLSFSRFLFMSAFQERFCKKVASDLRGYLDKEGASPFWESYGKKLILEHIDIKDIFEGRYNQHVIQDLMPKNPIYISLLTDEARACLGKTHTKTEPALHLLKEQGFRKTNFINVYDAGPFVTCELKNIKTVQQHKEGIVGKIIDADERQEPYIICNRNLNFKSTLGYLEEYAGAEIGLPKNVALLLNVAVGDPISYVNITPQNESH